MKERIIMNKEDLQRRLDKIEEDYADEVMVLESRARYNTLTRSKGRTIWDAKKTYVSRLEALSEIGNTEAQTDQEIADLKAALAKRK